MTPRQIYERTSCACQTCQIGCRTMPGCLAPGDLELIANHLGKRPDDADWITTHFRASDGARVAQMTDDGSIRVFSVPSIVPAQRPNGECVFFEDDRCSIHEVSPSGCAIIDTHQDAEEGGRRSKAIILAQAADHAAGGLFSEVCVRLLRAGLVAPPLAQRRAAYAAEERLQRRISGPGNDKPARKSLEIEA